MEHREYIKLQENADVAILFIHGIVGTPNHFNELIKLAPQDFSIYNMLLDGHGKEAKDFAKSSMKKWESQVESTVTELLKNHREIYIVGHSMGTLLGIEAATKHKEITKLFLLASPLKIALKPKAFTTSMKLYFNKIKPTDYMAKAAQKCYGVSPTKNPFHYLAWLPRMVELLNKSRKTRNTLKKIDAYCVAYQSSLDELVSKKSIKCLKQNPKIIIKELKNSYHYYYDEKDLLFLHNEFKEMLKTKESKIK